MTLRLMLTTAALAILAIAVAADHALAQRMTDREGQRLFARGGPRVQPPQISLSHPDVVRAEPKDAHVNISPEALSNQPGPKFLAKTTINVYSKVVLSETDIDTLSSQVRQQASYFHVVGVRFRTEGEATGHFAWFLYWDGRETIRNILASAEKLKTSSDALAKFLREGEELVGTWADPNAFPGTYSLTVRGGRLWLAHTFTDGSGGDERVRLRVQNGGLLVGVYSVSEIGTFKTDGDGTDRVSVRLVGDQLHISDNSTGRAPWFVGSPSTSIKRSVLPKSEPGRVAGAFAKANFQNVEALLSCVRRSDLTTSSASTKQIQELRGCFSRADIERLGALAQIGASARISCGRDRHHPYRLTKSAEEIIWAALVADEEGHIAAREKHDAPSAMRDSGEAKALCPKILRHFGPAGTEISGMIEE